MSDTDTKDPKACVGEPGAPGLEVEEPAKKQLPSIASAEDELKQGLDEIAVRRPVDLKKFLLDLQDIQDELARGKDFSELKVEHAELKEQKHSLQSEYEKALRENDRLRGLITELEQTKCQHQKVISGLVDDKKSLESKVDCLENDQDSLTSQLECMKVMQEESRKAEEERVARMNDAMNKILANLGTQKRLDAKIEECKELRLKCGELEAALMGTQQELSSSLNEIGKLKVVNEELQIAKAKLEDRLEKRPAEVLAALLSKANKEIESLKQIEVEKKRAVAELSKMKAIVEAAAKRKAAEEASAAKKKAAAEAKAKKKAAAEAEAKKKAAAEAEAKKKAAAEAEAKKKAAAEAEAKKKAEAAAKQ